MSTQTWFITGASSGLGASVANAALRAGHRVAVTARDKVRLEKLTEAHPDAVLPLSMDLTKPSEIKAAITTAEKWHGGIDVLVNNAAYAYRGEIGALDVSKMKEMFDTNVFGLVDLTNRVVPEMKARAQGDIVNIASTSGMKGAATATAYAGSKWALRGISQCWQAELRPHGIRVICVCPSEVQTNFGGRGGRNNPNKLNAQDIGETIMAALDMPRRALWPELAVFATNPWKED